MLHVCYSVKTPRLLSKISEIIISTVGLRSEGLLMSHQLLRLVMRSCKTPISR